MTKPAVRTPPSSDLYERDFYAWTQEQARLLGEGRWTEVDRANLAEEIEDVGRSQKSEIRSRLVVLLIHLLKWEFQPDSRKYGWRATLLEQRISLEATLEQSPSLVRYPAEILERAYAVARTKGAEETGISPESFPPACPYSAAQILDTRFYPGRPEPELD